MGPPRHLYGHEWPLRAMVNAVTSCPGVAEVRVAHARRGLQPTHPATDALGQCPNQATLRPDSRELISSPVKHQGCQLDRPRSVFFGVRAGMVCAARGTRRFFRVRYSVHGSRLTLQRWIDPKYWLAAGRSPRCLGPARIRTGWPSRVMRRRTIGRSEERRVGKEGRWRGWRWAGKKNEAK